MITWLLYSVSSWRKNFLSGQLPFWIDKNANEFIVEKKFSANFIIGLLS